MSWIEFLQVNREAKFRLFCCHYSGGSANSFYSWLKKIPETVELAAIELPGRGARFNESPLNMMRDVIEGLFVDFRSLLDKPFLLFGHSVGALISFELARKLQNNSLKLPEQLIVSGCRAPHMPMRRKPISNLLDDEFILELKKYNGTPKDLFDNKEMLNLFLPVLRADFTVSENYECADGKPLSCEIIALSGQNDSTVDENDVLEWRTHTNLNFQHYSIPGDHFFIRSSQNEVLNIIRQKFSLPLEIWR